MNNKIKELEIDEKVNDDKQNKSSLTYTLTPEIKENNKHLDDKLTEYIKSNQVKNIAISGIYGSGKTSFWLSYVNNNKKIIKPKEIITVALGKYHKDEVISNKKYNNLDSQDGKNFNNRLEKQILNQIASQIKNKRIPLSKYSSLQNKPWYWKLALFIFSLLTFVTNLSLIFKSNITSYFNISEKNIWWVFVSLYIIIFLLFYYIFIFSNYFKVKLFKFENLEIEKNNESIFGELSLLDKEINEIVYMLVSSKAKVVVFEDLDRYDDITIFEKLKEINFIVNNKTKRTIKFIYMIKDGLFESSEDKTKFFDAIIPIIPLSDNNNSESYIKELLADNYEDICSKVVWKISLYLNDLRVIKNIVNEYICYKEQISIEDLKLSNDKLFAIIVLKNLFPREFDEFLKNKGVIIELLNEKNTNVQSLEKEKYKDKLIKFVTFLINEELLDNSYYFYTVAFEKGVLTAKDTLFIKNILENNENDHTLKLDNRAQIVSRLDDFYFERKAVLNEDIFWECMQSDLIFDRRCLNKCLRKECSSIHKLDYSNKLKKMLNIEFEWYPFILHMFLKFSKNEFSIVVRRLVSLDLIWDLLERIDNFAKINNNKNACTILSKIIGFTYSNLYYKKETEIFWRKVSNIIVCNPTVLEYIQKSFLDDFIKEMHSKNLKFIKNCKHYHFEQEDLLKILDERELLTITVDNLYWLYDAMHGDEEVIYYGRFLNQLLKSKMSAKTKEYIKKDSFLEEYINWGSDEVKFENDESILIKIINSNITKESKIKYVSNNKTKLSDVSKIDNIVENEYLINIMLNKRIIRPTIFNINTLLDRLNYISKEIIEWLNKEINSENYSEIISHLEPKWINDIRHSNITSEKIIDWIKELENK
ncbi:YobI family P-loop NTPase [Mycoplasma yeatsii]|uniref:YobI-like P-loop NTPase domain-containing protein n=1 Tax=Mycoplasma yeatsii TaxID=51365 RepID=A0ABU0NG14_9MOLU|nr:hypothetical protein [Mycoplasma yeatsii]MDQ0567869.1 hypothetical protein [Mycoplasma yeatsii]